MALAAPLGNVDKITIVSAGNGDAAGMNTITGDITKIAAQVPALFETLSGVPLADLLGKVRPIGDKVTGGQHRSSSALFEEATFEETSREDELHDARSLGLSVALGAVMGAALGAATGHMGVWVAVGLAFYVAIASVSSAWTKRPKDKRRVR